MFVYNNNVLKKIKIFIRTFGLEGVIWLAALSYLALALPSVYERFHFCWFKLIGLGEYCPGCGLGHSITAFLHGNISQSWELHKLGIPAVAVLVGRILQLAKLGVDAMRFEELQIQDDRIEGE